MRMQHTSINVMSPHWQSDLRAIVETLVGFDETLIESIEMSPHHPVGMTNMRTCMIECTYIHACKVYKICTDGCMKKMKLEINRHIQANFAPPHPARTKYPSPGNTYLLRAPRAS